ncbi:hypothetical protein MMPV_006344 [Pyropia vietnamensis]
MNDTHTITEKHFAVASKLPVPQTSRPWRVVLWVGSAATLCMIGAVATSRAFPHVVPASWGGEGVRTLGSTLSWPTSAGTQRGPSSSSAAVPEAATAAASVGEAATDNGGTSIDGNTDNSSLERDDDDNSARATAALLPPPPLAASFRLPLDAAPPPDELYDVPRTIAALALPRVPSPPRSDPSANGSSPSHTPSQMALALYVQGSFRKFKGSPIHLRVTHCLVGDLAVPLSRQFESVWVCSINDTVTARLRHGDPLSVLVDEDNPLRRGNWQALQGAVRRGVTRRERISLAGGGFTRGLVVTTSVRWGETVDPDPPTAAAAAAATAAASTAMVGPSMDTGGDDHVKDGPRHRIQGGGGPPSPPSTVFDTPAMGVHRVCAMMQSIYEPATAVAWMDYHARLGVDRLFLYSNVVNSTEVMAEIAASPVYDAVEVVHWPWRRSQLAAGHHFLAAARGRCQWVLLFDVDEWLLVREAVLPPPPPPPSSRRHRHGGGGDGRKEPPLPPLLRALAALNASTGASTFVVRSLRMGSAGRVVDPHRPYPEAYTYRVDVPGPGKPIALTAETFPLTHVHTVHLRAARARMTQVPGAQLHQPPSHSPSATNNSTQPLAATNVTSPPAAAAAATASSDTAEEPLAPLVMIHYGFRSWEEEVAKWNAGRAAEEMRDFGDHQVTDPNDPSLADRRARHLSLDSQTLWTEMRDAWRAVMRRPWRVPVVVAAEGDARRLTDWSDMPSLVPT